MLLGSKVDVFEHKAVLGTLFLWSEVILQFLAYAFIHREQEWHINMVNVKTTTMSPLKNLRK